MEKEIRLDEVLIRAFPGLPHDDADRMVKQGKIQQYTFDTVLTHEDAYETTFYILMEGDVKVTKRINASEERLLSTLHAGDFFGEMAIINDAPRAATITALSPVTVLEIEKEAFSSLIQNNSTIALAMIREVSQRLRENDELTIEDLRLKAKELAEAYQTLADQDFARRRFLSTIANELRTPLMAANGFLLMARSGKLEGEALASALDTISRNLQEITTLTNDILFLQEMELILPDFQPTDIGRVVASVVEKYRSRADSNELGISMRIAPGMLTIMAEPRSLGRAFGAILDNAIKFSPDGGEIEVTVDQEPNNIIVSFRDQGVGIPEEALPRIFDRFFHLDEINGHKFRGAGLGLSIARQVIEQHLGIILVESELGKGSHFLIKLRRV
jgi:signal transduction histidine kinase